MLSSDHVHTIQMSVEHLSCTTRQLAACFYQHLFAASPSVREMFPPQMSPQVVKLEQMLVYILSTMNDPETLFPVLDELGQAHGDLGAVPAHYDAVGKALIAALRESVTGWTEEQEHAWGALYTLVCKRMMAAANPGPAD